MQVRGESDQVPPQQKGQTTCAEGENGSGVNARRRKGSMCEGGIWGRLCLGVGGDLALKDV